MSWFPGLPTEGKVGLAVLALIVLASMGALFFLWVRKILEFRQLALLEVKDRVGLKLEFIKTTAQILGGAFFLLTVYVTYQNLVVSQEKYKTDLFTKAVEQLGSDKLEVRLGGIYALERIARDSDKDHGPIMEVLTAYVREHAPWPPRKSPSEGGLKSGTPDPSGSAISPVTLRTDIQAILTVIGRRRTGHQERLLDLRHTDLRRAELDFARLEGAILILANLHLANLRYAKLKQANLAEVNLKGGTWGGANLQGAILDGANLTGRVNLFRVNLERASLVNAKLEGAHLLGADLPGADLRGANLAGANLEEADLREANLSAANLSKAWLVRANLGKAHLKKANLQEANLERANLEVASLNEAILRKANLKVADLRIAGLFQANLQGADLGAANLEGAHFVEANLQGADLRYAHMEGADLTKADLRGVTGLTKKQLDSAIIDDETKLPDHLKKSPLDPAAPR